MKQYLLFAGNEATKEVGLHGFVRDFDSVAEAFLSLVDDQTPAEWWHVLDTKTGEVIERRHVRLSNGVIGFQRSDWIVGTPAKTVAIIPPASKASDLAELEAGLRAVVTSGVKSGNGHANVHANGHASGHAEAAVEH